METILVILSAALATSLIMSTILALNNRPTLEQWARAEALRATSGEGWPGGPSGTARLAAADRFARYIKRGER